MNAQQEAFFRQGLVDDEAYFKSQPWRARAEETDPTFCDRVAYVLAFILEPASVYYGSVREFTSFRRMNAERNRAYERRMGELSVSPQGSPAHSSMGGLNGK